MTRLASLVLLTLATGCATARLPARALDKPEDFARLNLHEHDIAQWEDGLRTKGADGTYEWWYFDAHLDDGSTLVIVFYTRPLTDPNGPLAPLVLFDWSRPDGTKVERVIQAKAEQLVASEKSCDVSIGENRFVGDLHTYRVVVKDEGLSAELTLVGDVPAWRPKAGVMAFGEHDEKYFAWLPSVPQGRVTGQLTVAGQTHPVAGVGYHDHNWGNEPIPTLIHDWYWGRAELGGGYSVIASYITAAERYGSTTFPIFFLAKGGEVVADDGAKVRFTAAEVRQEPETKKPVADVLTYATEANGVHYRVSFNRKRDLVHAKLIDGLKGLTWLAAKLYGFDGAYLRFTGEVSLEVERPDQPIERFTNSAAVWELMYLGKAP